MVVIQGFPMHASHNSVWVTGNVPQNYPKSLNYGVLGYQRYNVPNNIPNPDSLGGRWFSKSKKRSKKRKSRKFSKKISRKRNFSGTKSPINFRELTPGGVSTETDWGFTNYSKFGKISRKRRNTRLRSRKRRKSSKKSKRRFSKKSKKKSKKSKKKNLGKSFGGPNTRYNTRSKQRPSTIGSQRSQRSQRSTRKYPNYVEKDYFSDDDYLPTKEEQYLREAVDYTTGKSLFPATPYKPTTMKDKSNKQSTDRRSQFSYNMYEIEDLRQKIMNIDIKIGEYLIKMTNDPLGYNLPSAPGTSRCVLSQKQCEKYEKKIWKLSKEQKKYRKKITGLEYDNDKLLGDSDSDYDSGGNMDMDMEDLHMDLAF
jgi:hypothetical protein